MRAASSLVPARFLCLLAHLSVLINLLWSSKNVFHCSPQERAEVQDELYRVSVGYTLGVVLIAVEAVNFISGLTMFANFVCLLSCLCHGLGTMFLVDMTVAGYSCEWYWPVFALCSCVPAVADVVIALQTLVLKKLI